MMVNTVVGQQQQKPQAARRESRFRKMFACLAIRPKKSQAHSSSKPNNTLTIKREILRSDTTTEWQNRPQYTSDLSLSSTSTSTILSHGQLSQMTDPFEKTFSGISSRLSPAALSPAEQLAVAVVEWKKKKLSQSSFASTSPALPCEHEPVPPPQEFVRHQHTSPLFPSRVKLVTKHERHSVEAQLLFRSLNLGWCGEDLGLQSQ